MSDFRTCPATGSPVYRGRHGQFKDLPRHPLAVSGKGLQHQRREGLMETDRHSLVRIMPILCDRRMEAREVQLFPANAGYCC